MSLDYNLKNCKAGKTNGAVYDALIAAKLADTPDTASGLMFAAGVCCMVADFSVEDRESIAETVARVEFVGANPFIHPTRPHLNYMVDVLTLLEGITFNVRSVDREEWIDSRSDQFARQIGEKTRAVTAELLA